jgi:hypothetical protein
VLSTRDVLTSQTPCNDQDSPRGICDDRLRHHVIVSGDMAGKSFHFPRNRPVHEVDKDLYPLPLLEDDVVVRFG